MKITSGGDASLLAGRLSEALAAGPQATHQLFGAIGIASRVAPLVASLGAAPLVASLGAALGSGAPAAAAPIKERRTGTFFVPELERCAGQRGCPVIAGAGARTKRLLGMKNLDIYALALYVDQPAARSCLQSKFRGAAAEKVAKDQALFDELVRAEGVEKSLRIVITSGLVKQRAFMDALEERLEPPLKKAGELAALQSFKEQFEGAPFRRGFEITFDVKGGRLDTSFDGKKVGSVTNRELARSLLDIYVGADPVSKGAKASFGAGLAAMVLT